MSAFTPLPPDWCPTGADNDGSTAFHPPSTKEILLEEISKTVGPDAIEAVTPTEELIEPPEVEAAPPTDFIPPCATQRPTPIALQEAPVAIMVGMEDHCPRWEPGSVIKYAVFEKGFKTPQDAKYAADHLHLAAQKWNECNIGVTFEWVPLIEDATFALAHGGDNGNALAQAFFPNPADLEWLLVYNAAFSMKYWKLNMWKVFAHELGHVLGLRHEFAMDVGVDGQTKEKKKAFQLGPRDPDSVMTYKPTAPEISEADITSTRAFYALQGSPDGSIPPMVGMTKVLDFTPM
ncbi:hypothetical protein V8F20_006574 [Naviculisporaceae sp. PSN 640]